MMQEFSMHSAVSVLDRLLENLEHMLKAGEANAKERGIEPEIFLTARLAPDMYHLRKQVQVITSLVKNCPHRVAGTEPPVFEETEETFNDLYSTIARAREEVAGFSPDTLNGKENRTFSVKLGPMDVEFTGLTYLTGFTLPNVYFHSATAYNILRQNGVPLGKMDFFGGRM